MIIRGIVEKGLGIGKKLGYPTANLEISAINRGKASGVPEALPRDIQPGVYAARTMVDEVSYYAVAVVGARMEHGEPLVEVHLLDFEGELHGKEIEVEVLQKVSEIEQLDNEEALVRKIEKDIRKVRLCLQG